MLLIDRYIVKTVVSAIVLIICMLTGLQVFILFVNELGDIGKGDYGVLQALIYVLMTMPYQVYLFLPMASLLGCLIGLGILASAHELIVMRASSMSITKITVVVLKVAIVLILIVTTLGEILFPKLVMNAADNKYQAVNAGQSLITEKGVWLRYKDNFINISKVIKENELENVLQFKFDKQHNLHVVRHIDCVKYSERKWRAYGVKETVLDNDSTHVFEKDEIDWEVKVKPSMLSLTSSQPDEMTFPELWKYLQSHKNNYHSVRNYQLAFWQRVVQPFTTVVMMMLAIPFVFGPLRSSTMGSKLLFGATVGFGFYILNKFFGSLSQVMQFSSILAAVGPTAFFAMFGFYLMSKVR